MLPNRGMWGNTEAPQLAPHQARSLSVLNYSISPLYPGLRGPGKCRNAPNLVSLASEAGGPSPGSSPEKKKKRRRSLLPAEILSAILDTFLKARRGMWGEGEFRGLHRDQTLRDLTLGPQPSPRPGKSLSLILLRSPSPPQRGPATLLAFPPDPQENGGREPLPTENSHFFAARFRNTPGLMPFGELCNQGHRSGTKQTRLCVHPRPRGSTPEQGGAPAGPRVGLVCSAKAAGGGQARAPRRGGPQQSAEPRAG